MATVKKQKYKSSAKRVAPIKPNLRGARNMVAASYRAANYSKAAAIRFWSAIVFIVFLTIFGALWLGGLLPNVQQAGSEFKKNRLIALGFVVDRIDVLGEGRLKEEDVLRALQIQKGDYLFEGSLVDAKERVESLNWVDDALIRRLWPDRIVVQIVERRPYALWQKDGDLKLVDATGFVIENTDTTSFSKLPLFVGAGAEQAGLALNEVLERYPDIASRLDASIFVGEQRWDLILNNRRLRVKLPAGEALPALDRLMALHAKTQILDRAVEVIDLRLADRISLSPKQADRV